MTQSIDGDDQLGRLVDAAKYKLATHALDTDPRDGLIGHMRFTLFVDVGARKKESGAGAVRTKLNR